MTTAACALEPPSSLGNACGARCILPDEKHLGKTFGDGPRAQEAPQPRPTQTNELRASAGQVFPVPSAAWVMRTENPGRHGDECFSSSRIDDFAAGSYSDAASRWVDKFDC